MFPWADTAARSHEAGPETRVTALWRDVFLLRFLVVKLIL